MNTLLKPLRVTILGSLKSRTVLHLEVLALRQQLAMIAERDRKRLRFHPQERWFWILLYRLWPSCMQTLMVFQPDTLVRWHRKGFRLYWRWKSCRGRDGRPIIKKEVRELIRTMSRDNVGWSAPRYLLRDRDSIYSDVFRRRVKSLGIVGVLTAPRSPWQSPYVERLIGSIRRECLNHVIVLNECHLRRRLRSYFTYYHDARTHFGLVKQCPKPSLVETPDQGKVIAFPHVGGLHHEYRRAA